MGFKDFMRDWLQPGSSGPDPDDPYGKGRPPDVAHYASQADPWAELHTDLDSDAYRNTLIMGVGDNGNFIHTESRRHLLILGPTGSAKTTGVLVPAILGATGPVVSTSTKNDVYRATAHCRARMGSLWHFSVDGSEPLPGCRPLRWSPVTSARQWDRALMTGRSMAGAAEADPSSSNSGFFRQQASTLIALLLHAAALGDKDLAWVLRALNTNRRALADAEDILTEVSPARGEQLGSFTNMDPRTRDSVLATARNAFAGYDSDAALATTTDPNFDPLVFAEGQPTAINKRAWRPIDLELEPRIPEVVYDKAVRGWYGTIYITASTRVQALVAPLIVGLLAEIEQATYETATRDQAQGYYGRAPVFFALDEVASIAPMPGLGTAVAQGGGQNLLLAAVLQDLGQATARWAEEGKTFLTQFGELVVFPGIRNEDTLRQLSSLVGQRWVPNETVSESTTRGQGGRSTTYSTQSGYQQVPELSPSDIFRLAREGDDLEKLDPRRTLTFTSTGEWGWTFATPYYLSPPFVQMVIRSLRAMNLAGPTWEAWCDIPPAELTRYGKADGLVGAGGPGLPQEWNQTLSDYDGLRARRRRVVEIQAANPLIAGYNEFESQGALQFKISGSTFRSSIITSASLQFQDLVTILDVPGMAPPDQSWIWSPEDKYQPSFVFDVDEAHTEIFVFRKPGQDFLLDNQNPAGFGALGSPAQVGLWIETYDRVGLFMAERIARGLAQHGPTVMWSLDRSGQDVIETYGCKMELT